MRILGIDYGEKRVGLALSDETETLARELKVLPAKQILPAIKSLVIDQKIGRIVVGLPLTMSGQDSIKTLEVREFVATLQKQIGIPVVTQDERLTTDMALNIPGGHKQVDSLAAQIMLQMHLDKQKSL